MRIIIVTHYFPPETGAPQARLSGLAAAWAADGDDVTVLTGMPNHPTGVIRPEYRGAIRRRERRHGYRVLRTWLYATPNEGITRKTIGHLSFMITSVLLGSRASGPADVVVVSSPTFFAIGSGWVLARLKRARLVVEVRDLWPAIFTELGVLTSRPVIRLLERLELAAYAAADTVIVVSDGFRANLIARGVPAEKVHTIRNGVRPGEFDPDASADPQLRGRLGAGPDDCLVLYAGTHGISQGLTSIADAAARLTGERIRFAFVGEGADKERLRRRGAELRLRNVTMLPGVPHEQVPALLAAADICLVPLRDVPLFSSFIPSKMFEYLAAGRPVVGALAGEAAQILREAGARVVPPADSDALADAIRMLAADPQQRQAMGREGRCYVEKYFDRATLARQYRKFLDAPAASDEAPDHRRPQLLPAARARGVTRTDLAILGRTVVHLRPVQPVHRARLRTQQAGLRRFPQVGRLVLPGPDPAAAVGWPAAARPVDALTPGRWPGLAELRAGQITLLGLVRKFGDVPGWEHPDAPRLWRFHLHYWDWAWGLAADPDRLAARALFARLWRSWQATAEFGRGDAWHPYPTALRAWSWCGLHRDLAAGSDIEPDFVNGLAGHAGFLRRHLEYDLGGNHLIKDLKALVGLAVFFADERLLRLALRRLSGQMATQVLPDGGHYERSPAYHCQVLADLIDVADLLRAAGRSPGGEITAAIDRMRGWLGAVLTPGGQVPMLNDGYPVDSEFIAALRPGPIPPAADGPLLVLPDTGLVRAVAGGWHLLADVGPPCPPSLPGHAHADTFGCLLHVDRVPLLIDTGTSTYEPGPVRQYERSTAAHSTLQVDGADSTEVWGVFRAGRRAQVSGLAVHADASLITCEAAHDGFRGLRGRPSHHRRWSLTSDGLQIEDTVTGRGRHEIVIRWQLAAGSAVRVVDRAASVTSPAGHFSVTVAATAPVELSTETRAVATGFGSTAGAPMLTCRMDAVLAAGITTVWSRARGGAGGKRET